MKKFVSLILLCSLVLVCASACTVPSNDGEETTVGNVEETTAENTEEMTVGNNNETTNAGSNENGSANASEVDILKLNEVFDTIRDDAKKNTKLGFSVEYEQVYYEFKDSGQYANSNWSDSVFIVTINCDYETAINEDWYEQCSEKDIKSLNAAFYNYYSAGLSKGNYSNIVFSPGMHLMYNSHEDFNNDYAAIKALTDLHYVTEVHIVYRFPVPNDYFLE